MKDSEIRGLLLQKYYENRRGIHGEYFLPAPSDFDNKLTEQDILFVSAQLGEHGLLKWNGYRTAVHGLLAGKGKITAKGIDVIEGTEEPSISITINPINITSSSNIIIGDSNTQNINANIEAIVRAIQESKESPEKKAEAKSRLKKFLEHPLVSAITNGALSSF
jgi:hypothetical protein